GGIRAPAAQTGGDGDALHDLRRKLAVTVGAQLRERARDDRVVRKAGDLDSIRTPHLDVVRERHALVDRRELVLPVRALRADDQREIDLRGGDSASHRSARASAMNSGGESSSARVAGGRPIVSSAAAASWRVASSLSSRELASVFRRCANAAPTTRFTCA